MPKEEVLFSKSKAKAVSSAFQLGFSHTKWDLATFPYCNLQYTSTTLRLHLKKWNEASSKVASYEILF